MEQASSENSADRSPSQGWFVVNDDGVQAHEGGVVDRHDFGQADDSAVRAEHSTSSLRTSRRGRQPGRRTHGGEPRVFAFCWTFYLLLATMGAFWSIGATGVSDASSLRPASRSLLAAMAVGLVILWPMVRLSQERQGSGSSVVLKQAKLVIRDLLVLLIPAQAIIWPQVVMAGWPVEVVGALSLAFVSWTVLIGGVLVVARSLDKPGPGVWMAAIVAMCAVGPIAGLVAGSGLQGTTGSGLDVGWLGGWWMSSPLTAGFELTRDRFWSGAAAAVSLGHWRAIALVGGIALVVWTIVLGWGLSGRAGRA